MAVILKRTIFIDESKGPIRFHDFAQVITSEGTMIEPFAGYPRLSPDDVARDFDFEDEMSRIDEIRNYNPATSESALVPFGEDETPLQGGFCMRVGR